MNKKYRLFGKIPVVDVLIVIVLFAILAVGAFFLSRGEVKEQTGAESQVEKTYPFEAVLCVEGKRELDYALVEVGDKLYTENGTYAATVTAKEKKPHYKYGVNAQTGQTVKTEIEGRVDIFITVKGEATARDNNGIYIGKKRVAYNNKIPLGNEKIFWKMLTVDITREEA